MISGCYQFCTAKEELTEKLIERVTVWKSLNFLKVTAININFQGDEVLLHERLGGGGSGAFVRINGIICCLANTLVIFLRCIDVLLEGSLVLQKFYKQNILVILGAVKLTSLQFQK